jgi:hypothetical protein
MSVKAKPRSKGKADPRMQGAVKFVVKVRRQGGRKLDDIRARARGTSGLGLSSYLAAVFEANERLPKYKKLTDEMIRDLVLQDFKDVSDSFPSIAKLRKGTVGICYYRSLYNHGDLTGKVKPEVRSCQYNDKGETVHPRTGKAMARADLNVLYQTGNQHRGAATLSGKKKG